MCFGRYFPRRDAFGNFVALSVVLTIATFVPGLPHLQVTGATDKTEEGGTAAGLVVAGGDGGATAPRLFGSELLYEHPEILLAVVRTYVLLRGGEVVKSSPELARETVREEKCNRDCGGVVRCACSECCRIAFIVCAFELDAISSLSQFRCNYCIVKLF